MRRLSLGAPFNDSSEAFQTWARKAIMEIEQASYINPDLGLTAADVGAQPADATLTSIALLGTAADRLAYTTGVNAWAETPLTAAARTVLDDTTVAAMLATLVGAWTAYTPTVTSQTGTLTSYTVNKAAWLVIGKLGYDHNDIAITNAGTGATGILVTNPPSVPATGRLYPISGRETVAFGYGLTGNMTPSQKLIYKYDGTFPGATNNRLVFTTVYEVA